MDPEAFVVSGIFVSSWDVDSVASTKKRLEPALDAPMPSRHRPFPPLVFKLRRIDGKRHQGRPAAMARCHEWREFFLHDPMPFSCSLEG